jgi:hypothetical protein
MIREMQIRKNIEGKDSTAKFKLRSKHFRGESRKTKDIWMTNTVAENNSGYFGVSKFFLCYVRLCTYYVVGNLLHV